MSRYEETMTYVSLAIWLKDKQKSASEFESKLYGHAVEAAKRSMPLFPVVYDEPYGPEAFCPKCQNDLDMETEPYYCEHCGQALDWAEEIDEQSKVRHNRWALK